MKTASAILSAMAQCTGTSQYYRHGLMPTLLLTDGAKMVADDAGAWWLMDVIMSHLSTNATLRQEEFQHWRFVRNGDGPHLVSVTDGNEGEPIVTQEVEYSDFPLPEIGFFVCRDEGLGGWVLMLPSEY